MPRQKQAEEKPCEKQATSRRVPGRPFEKNDPRISCNLEKAEAAAAESTGVGSAASPTGTSGPGSTPAVPRKSDLELMRWVWANPGKARKRTPEWSWEELRQQSAPKFLDRMTELEKTTATPPASVTPVKSAEPPSPEPKKPPPEADEPTEKLIPLIDRLLEECRREAGTS